MSTKNNNLSPNMVPMSPAGQAYPRRSSHKTVANNFLKEVMTQRKAETENVKSSQISDRGMYQTRCNFSVLSNYILFVIFIA